MIARTKSSSTARFFAASICALLLVSLSPQAQAECSWVNGSKKDIDIRNVPLALDVPFDSGSGTRAPTPLSDWLNDSSTVLWDCSAWLGGVGISLSTEAPVTDNNLTYDGHTVYKTPTPGIGFIGKYTLYTTRGYGEQDAKLSNVEREMNVRSPAQMGIYDFRVRLIQIGPIKPGAVLPRFEFAKATSWASRDRSLISHLWLPPIRVNVPTCQIPGVVEVPLGKVSMHKFKGVGSEAGSQDFEIPLRNCPGGFNSISYQLKPISPIIDADKGLLQVDRGSGTASGIAVRITGRGAEAKFGTELSFGYTGAAGNFSIPLSASYYQTGPITPGTANAALEFIIIYL